MQLTSKLNKGFRFSLCVVDVFSKYTLVVPFKDKKGVSIVNAFHKILNDSARIPNKMWVDKGSEFYNNSFKKWLKDNHIEMYLIHNEGKSIVAERFIRTLKINDLNAEEIIGIFYEKELQKNNQQEFRIKKVIKKKGDKLYVKLKGYDSSFNSWIDKNGLIK